MTTLRKSINTLMKLDRGDGTRGCLRVKTVWILVTLLAVIALQLPGDIYAEAPWPPVGGTITSINDGSGDQVGTRISGTLAAYASIVDGTSEVRYHDLLTGTDVAIPTGGGLDFLPDVNGSMIVYTHVTNGEFEIHAFDTADASQPPAELDPQPASQRERPAIGGQTVAWTDYGFDNDLYHSEIVVYDLSTGSATRLTDDDYYNFDPDVSPDGSMIVWTRCEIYLSGCRVRQATRSGAGWSFAQLSGDQESTTPALDNQFVAYQGNDANGESDIYWRALGGGDEHRISLAEVQRNPAISGGVLVFETLSGSGPTASSDILLYDLATGALYTVADTSATEVLPDIAVAPDGLVRVVWMANGPTDANVYARSFSLPTGDATPPTITLSAPAGTTYMLNQVVLADYACTDEIGGSGLESCTGTVTNGSAIDTATVGVKTFTVTATDYAGNTASQSVSYTVAYNVCALYDQGKAHKLGSTVPIKLQLCDASGANVSAPDVVVHASGLIKLDNSASGDLAEPGNANPDNDFRFDAALGGSGGYIYNLSTQGLSTGTWSLQLTASEDPVTHVVQFDLR